MSAQSVTLKGKTYTLDDHGFLYPSEQWNENFAEGMAERLGIFGGLTEKHWAFISYLRKKFVEEKAVPPVVTACANNQVRLHEFRTLFPTGYHRGACKIAGINYQFMYDHNIWLTYENYPILKNRYRMTPLGFLEDFDQWDERFAHLMASEWNLPEGFTERHQAIIRFLRDFYARNKNIPTIQETCKANNLSLEAMGELFPEGYRRGACRVAGLPFLA